MIGNAHIDPVWLWPWQEGYQEARATFKSALDRMDEYDDFVFTCDQMLLLAWVEEADPALFAKIQERAAEGRWINVGGWWVEPDCNMPVGESFARQGLYGQRYLAAKFGARTEFGMNVDPFGHNAMLPQILRLQGLTGYAFLRPGPHEKTLPQSLFWWEAPDGSRVLAHRIPFEYTSTGGEVDYHTEKSIAQLDPSLPQVMVFYGVGNHGGGPTKVNIESIYRYDRMGTFGDMTMSSPLRFVSDFLEREGREALDALPVWRGDLQHHAPGCYSSHSGVKMWQRKAQAAVLSAERWAAAVAVSDDIEYPRAELEHAWKQILFNQFHDVLPGSAIESAYDDARDQLGEAISIAKRIINRSQNVIARQIDIPLAPEQQPLVAFNPHPWPVTKTLTMHYHEGGDRSGMHVVDADGAQVPTQIVPAAMTTAHPGQGAVAFVASLPAFGYRLYYLRAGAAPAKMPWSVEPPARLTATQTTLENPLVRLEIDPETGWICSLLDKRTGADLMKGAHGHHTQICEDPTDTWGHRVVSYNWPGAAMRLDRISLRESGSVRAVIRVDRSWGRSTLTEEFILEHDADRIEVRVSLDWREPAHLLKLRFPVALTEPTATFEIPYGTLERPVNGSEEPGQSWVDLTGVTSAGAPAGLAVINNAKHGYDVSPAGTHTPENSPSIGITAVRSPVYAWHDPRVLDPEETYAYHDQGVQKFTYLLVPHAGDWRDADLTQAAALLNAPPRVMRESFHEGRQPQAMTLASSDSSQVIITAIKASEDNDDIVVRAVESHGKPARVHLHLPLLDRSFAAEFRASQIRTWRVPRDPAQPIAEVDLTEYPLTDQGDGGQPALR